MITYHMRCPENGDTQRQAVEPGKPLSCVRAGMQIFARASASNPTFFFHGGPSPRRSTRPPSLVLSFILSFIRTLFDIVELYLI